jgi:hypothetical protein
MTAAPKSSPYGSRCRDVAKRRPCPNGGKADVLGEETGVGTPRAAGVGVQAREERVAENVGKGLLPAGTRNHLQRRLPRA